MHRSETRPAGIVAWAASVFLVALATLLTAHPAAAEIYDVTETDCGSHLGTGPGELLWAIEQANANLGPDSIEIVAGLEITACPFPRNDNGDILVDESSLVITDDLTIEGNGATYNGKNLRVTANGYIDLVSRECKLEGGRVLGLEASLFRIGEYDTDNSVLEVSINGLTVKRASQIATVRNGAKLTLRDVTGLEITDLLECARPAIRVFGSANLVLENVHLDGLSSYKDNNLGYAIEGDEGTLEMYHSRITRAVSGYAVSWGGNADIVSSIIQDAGGLEQAGAGTMNVVNSLIWPDANVVNMRSSDRSYVVGGGTMHFKASTVLYQALSCGRAPLDNCYLQFYPYDGALQAYPGSSMIFKESIAHVQVQELILTQFPFPLLSDTGAGSITADEFTFMQPLPWQDADDLKRITGQNLLRTTPPALEIYPPLIIPFPENVTPLLNGVANDQIPNAGTGGGNELFDPRGNPITHDVLGNPRTDEGFRSIGAVQNSLVPHLTVLATGNGNVLLEWSTPRDLVPDPAPAAYRVSYRVKGVTNWMFIDFPTPIGNVPGLTNGTAYEFQVDTLVNGSPAGHPSNIVTATPSGDVLDCSAAYPSPDSLWPPNHKLVPIAVLGINESHDHPVTLSIDGVFQDEPVNGKGDGNTRPDATGIGSSTASVRAERAGNGNGRVYTINFTALSDGGAQCKGSVEVGVPKSKNRDAVNDGPLFNSMFD